MKKTSSIILAIVLLSALPIAAQESVGEDTPATQQDSPIIEQTKVLTKIPDGTPPPPSPKPVLPVFRVKNTMIRHFEVSESPEMPELPPIQGTISSTVRLVEDPRLPQPVIPPHREVDPAQKALFMERLAKYVWPVRATVTIHIYDRRRTEFRWSFWEKATTGESVRKQYIAWSNMDFTYFGHFCSYQVAQADGTAKKYDLMSWVTGIDSNRERLRCQRANKPYIAPEIPELPDMATSGAMFVIMGDDDDDPKAVDFLMDLHQLYQVEGARMERLFYARLKARNERKAYLLANPPKPKNLVLNYWRGKRTEPQTEGVGQ